MKICSFDPGTNKTGIAILEDGNIKETKLIKVKPKKPLAERQKELIQGISDFVSEKISNIDYIGIETQYVGWNRQGTIKLSEFTGIIKGWFLCQYPCQWGSILNITPSEAKKALTGKGNASKEVVKQYAEALIGKILSQDEADAVAIGLATQKKGWEIESQ